MNEKITLMLQGVPPSLNEMVGRKSYHDYRRKKREWTELVQWAIIAAHCKPKKPFERAHVTITYYFPTAAKHDADNYAGKYLLDGLTRGGIIVDDDIKHITTMIRGKVDRKNPRTLIEVEETESGGTKND